MSFIEPLASKSPLLEEHQEFPPNSLDGAGVLNLALQLFDWFFVSQSSQLDTSISDNVRYDWTSNTFRKAENLQYGSRQQSHIERMQYHYP